MNQRRATWVNQEWIQDEYKPPSNYKRYLYSRLVPNSRPDIIVPLGCRKSNIAFALIVKGEHRKKHPK